MKKETILRRVPALCIAALIFYLSSRPTLPVPLPPILGADKLAHLAAYAVLSFLACFWIRAESWKRRPVLFFVSVVLIVSLYGALDEFHQSFVPGRMPSVWDWLADTLGAGLGVLVYRGIPKPLR